MNKVQRTLNNKIPPPLVTVLCILPVLFSANYSLSSLRVDKVLASLLLLAASAIAVLALLEFRKLKTTVNPLEFDNVNQLVVSGIFNFSRNPMYLSLLIVILATAVASHAYGVGVIMAGIFWLYMTQFQIKPEEAFLKQHFGSEYIAYSQVVRRWL